MEQKGFRLAILRWKTEKNNEELSHCIVTHDENEFISIIPDFQETFMTHFDSSAQYPWMEIYDV